MILIITNNSDQSTCHVVDWLHFLNENYTIITDNTPIEIIDLQLSGYYKIRVNNIEIESNNLKSIWYRRGFLKFEIKICDKINKSIYNVFKNYSIQEGVTITNFINYCFSEKYNINNFNYSRVNKLLVLKYANDIGLTIPNTFASIRCFHPLPQSGVFT